MGIIFHAEVKRSGRRTYLNMPDPEVKSCRIEPGDTLLIRLVEVEHVSEREKIRKPQREPIVWDEVEHVAEKKGKP